MPERQRSSDGPIAVGALVVITAAVAALVLERAGSTAGFRATELAAFGMLIAVSGLFEIPLPNGVPFSLGLAPGIGFALLGTHPAPEVTVLFAVATAASIVLRALLGRNALITVLAVHVMALAAAVGVYGMLARNQLIPKFGDLSSVRNIGHEAWAALIGTILAMLAVVLLVHALVHTARAVHAERIPFRPVLFDQLRSAAPLHLSIISVAALLALAFPSLRYWSFPLLLAPLAATQFAFKQFSSIKKTYLQTIRALSKVPEMAGYTQPGHSTRVAELSVAIAREMGVGQGELNEIEYAALLHDIGRVSLPDPESAEKTSSRTELAVVGAAIVRETGHFPGVATMIERQHDQYRQRGEDTDRGLPSGSKIIKVASTYDDLTRPGGIGLSSWDAIERLHHGMAYDFDPQVIQALTKVLEKRGSI